MNPKDMTHVELLSEAMASMLDIGAYYEGLEQERADSDVIRVELLRRLDEADALRKENEKLRRDAERYRFIRDNADTIAINSSLQYCDIYRSEGIEEGLDTAMKFESDYAMSAKAKESEASHD